MSEAIEVKMIREIKDADRPEIGKEANSIVKGITRGKDNRDIETQIERISTLGQATIRKSDEMLKSLNVPVKDIGDNNVAKQLLDLRNHMEQITPQKLTLKPGGVSGMLNKMWGGNPVSKFLQKHESVKTQVHIIVSSLYESQNMLQKRIALLKERRINAEDAIYAIKKDIATLEQVHVFLNNELENASTPERKTYVEEALAKTLRRMQSMHLRIAVYLNSIASSKILAQTGDDLNTTIDDMAPLAEVVLEETFNLILALQEQENVANAIDEMQNMMSSLIESNAARVDAHAQKTVELRTKPMLQLDKVKNAFNLLNSAFEKLEVSNRQVIDSSRKIIAEVAELNDKVEGRINGQQIIAGQTQERINIAE